MQVVQIPFGNQTLEMPLPDSADVLRAGTVNRLQDPIGTLERRLAQPIGTPALTQLLQGRSSAAVVVSDNTRPVPYREPHGILAPLLKVLKNGGISDIRIIVACGTHRAMEEHELRQMLGQAAFENGVRIINHIATDSDMLRSLGHTQRTADVTVNKHYMEAEIKIATGLVEPHFMAGYSGGRKAICPGICGQNVTYTFHSAHILNDPKATTLVLDGNPCHEESLAIAKMAGVDFTVNVTIDARCDLTGIFCGDLESAHRAAVKHLLSYVAIPIQEAYDIVVTPAGAVGINHYQCVKAAFEACRALKAGGTVILTADLTDPDPIGGENYKRMLRLGVELGPQGFVRKILSPDWVFVPEQWEVQMWAKVFAHLGNADRLLLCAPRISNIESGLIPEVNVAARVARRSEEDELAFAARVVQQTLECELANRPEARVLVLPDGPYAICRKSDGSRTVGSRTVDPQTDA